MNLQKMGILFLFFFLTSCTYLEKKSQYNQFQGSSYLKESLKQPPSSDVPLPSIEGIKKHTSYIELLKKTWDQKTPPYSLVQDFYNFENPLSKQLRQRIKKGEGDNLLKEKVTMDLLLNMAYLQNPSLQKAYQKLQTILAEYSQASFLEEIIFSYQSFTRDLNIRVGSGIQRQPLGKKYPYPSTLSLKGEILEAKFQMAREKYKIAFRNMMVKVLQAYYQAIYLEKAIAITKTHQSLLSSIHKVIIRLYESGRAHHSVVLRVQVEISKIADQLITLEETKSTNLAVLNRELSRDSSSSFGKFHIQNLNVPSQKLPEFLKFSSLSNQEIQFAKIDVRKLEVMVKLIREKFHPDFVQGHGLLEDGKANFYGTRRKSKTLQPKLRPMVRPWFAFQESYLREVEWEVKQKSSEYRKVQDRIFFQVKKTYYDLDEAIRQVKLYRVSLLPRASQAYQVAKRGYEGGKVTFDSLIDAERVLLRFQLALDQATRDRNFEVLNLMKVVGKKW